MKRGLCGALALTLPLVLAAATIAQAQAAAQTTTAATASGPAPQKFTLEGQAALWSVAIKPDKAADFETIMRRVREALLKSDSPERQKQAAGWKVLKISKPLPDGNIVYVHVIDPVVPGVDYSVMQTLYDAFPDERQALYDLYRNAFAQNLSLAAGGIVMDMSKPTQTAAAGETR
jgi:hypothetical protein